MKVLNSFSTAAAGLLLITGAAAAQNTSPYGEGIDPACFRAANDNVAVWKSQGKSDAEVERLYQQALAVCNGNDPAMAAYVGTANVDYTRLGRMLLRDAIAPNLYITLVRDRGRKLRRARLDPTWLSDYARGDSDGDLVPDARDRCPGTRDLTPTNDEGCPTDAPLVPAPSSREVDQARDALGWVASRACDGGPVPAVSVPLKAGYDNVNRSMFAIATSTVNDQPPNCTMFYEVQIRLSSPTSSQVPAVQIVQLLFRNTENTDPSTSGRQVFRTRATDTGSRKLIFDQAKYYNMKEIRVRAVNGNGLTGGWSSTRTYPPPSFNEP